MELKDFIKNTLVQVSKGIEEAKQELGDTKKFQTIINPHLPGVESLAEENGQYKKVQDIEFDIALVVEQKQEGKAGIGVLASVIKAGVSHTDGNTNSETHRIKFSVPVKFA
jgi:hypothetical protein